MAQLLLIVLFAIRLAWAWSPDYILRVSEQVISPNCQPRLSVVVNGTTPGPLLTFYEGQHVWIRVHNDLPHENTTMHWHGFTQFLTPFADGTPMVSGWPIPPGHYFDYEFQLEPGHIGTYWYHSHVDLQLHTAQGPIVVHPADDRSPVAYDEETILQLGEYYLASDQAMTANLLNRTLFKWIGDPQALLVNGRAPGKCNTTLLAPGQNCEASCGLHVQHVRPSTRYRVRIIGATFLSDMVIALEGHNMTLFEVDGTYIEPMPISSLEVHSGQRYSVLIETPETPSKAHQFVEWNTTDQPPADSEVTRTIILAGQQRPWGPSNGGLQWRINNRTFANENKAGIPYLLDFYNRPPGAREPNYQAAVANGGYDASTNLYPAQLGEVLDIVLQNQAGALSGVVEAHPWHMHGKKYWDLGTSPGNYSVEAFKQMRALRDGRAIRRDTSVLYSSPGSSISGTKIEQGGPGGWRVLRIRVEDAGAWLLHCHITPHAQMGMSVLMMFGAEALPPISAGYLEELTSSFPQNITHMPARWFEEDP